MKQLALFAEPAPPPRKLQPWEEESEYYHRIWLEILTRNPNVHTDWREEWRQTIRGQNEAHFCHERGWRSPRLRFPIRPNDRPFSDELRRYPFYRRVIPWGCVSCFFTLWFVNWHAQ